ncbi:hypothetical protein DFP72DRAFT_1147640 [Ephemerocybe angulata]|uniref:Uncharacterized protein n=1 Tax=Ephemerocybe angulata TaxID=980116 RepID=A0A8H6HKZ4_9AGAR|nr:hypothetical protein DFP72DRAFT_1147640 [Tulosesus angulatus]
MKGVICITVESRERGKSEELPNLVYELGSVIMRPGRFHELHLHEDLEKAVDAFKRAIKLAPRGTTSEKPTCGVRAIPRGRSNDAQDPRTIDLGVFIFEQSQSRRQSNIQRCLAWSQLNNLRTPLDDLRAVDEVADRVLEVSKALDASGAQSKLTNIDLENTVSDAPISTKPDRWHTDLTVEWNRSVPSVRTKTLLQNIPTHETVAIINVHAIRCGALALQSGRDPNLIPVAGFSMAKAKSMSVQVREQLGMRGVKVRGRDFQGRVVHVAVLPWKKAHGRTKAGVGLVTHWHRVLQCSPPPTSALLKQTFRTRQIDSLDHILVEKVYHSKT